MKSPFVFRPARARALAADIKKIHSVVAPGRHRVLAGALLAVLSAPAVAAEDYKSLKAELEALRQEVLQASEGKDVHSTVHLAGYAAVNYIRPETGDSSFSGTTFNPIFHYQYKDLLLLESELEVELENDGTTEVALEYLSLDLILNDYMVLVAGKFLSPIGQFRQNIHPAWINKLPSLPVGFGMGEAAPTNEVGLQMRGGFPLGPMRANYAVYTGNGPRLVLDATTGMIMMVETRGQGSDNNGNKVVGGRFGLLPIPKLELGVSYATAKTSGTEGAVVETNRDYNAAGADIAWQIAGFDLRGEYIQTRIGANTAGMSMDPGEKEWKAWYAQAAWRIPGTHWEPVVRYGAYTLPTGVVTRQWAPGVNYVFAANVIAKLAYEVNDTDGVTGDDRALVQLAYGF